MGRADAATLCSRKLVAMKEALVMATISLVENSQSTSPIDSNGDSSVPVTFSYRLDAKRITDDNFKKTGQHI
jgi:hypothetical protein